MNKFLRVTMFVLASITIVSAGYVKAGDDNGTLPHVDANHQFPPNGAHTVRKTFELHIPKNSKQISELIIQVPEVVNWSNNAKDVAVTEGNGKKVKPTITIKDRNIIINFAEPVPANTQLEVDIKNVRRVRGGNGPVYGVSAKFVGSNTITSIGTARFSIR